MKEEIYIRLHPNNINRDSRIEIPEAWFLLIKKHSSRSQIRTTADQSEATAHTNNEVSNAPISAAKNRPIRTELGVIEVDESTKTSKARSFGVAIPYEHWQYAVKRRDLDH